MGLSGESVWFCRDLLQALDGTPRRLLGWRSGGIGRGAHLLAVVFIAVFPHDRYGQSDKIGLFVGRYRVGPGDQHAVLQRE